MSKVTVEQIKKRIINVYYTRIPNTTVTICSLALENGFNVQGESACVSSADFDAEKGKQLAYNDAFNKIWPLEAYLLAERINMDKSLRSAYRDFGWALDELKHGNKVQRLGWNGIGLWLELQIPDSHSKMTLPYIYINYPEYAKVTPGARVPWLASQTDILADDWVLAQ